MKRQLSGSNGTRPNDPRLANRGGLGSGGLPSGHKKTMPTQPQQQPQRGTPIGNLGHPHRNVPQNNFYRGVPPPPGRGGPMMLGIGGPPNQGRGGRGGPPPPPHRMGPPPRAGAHAGLHMQGGAPLPPIMQGRGNERGLGPVTGNLGRVPLNSGRGMNNGNRMMGGPTPMTGLGETGPNSGRGERRPVIPPPPPPPLGRGGMGFPPPRGPPPPPPRPMQDVGRISHSQISSRVPPPPVGGPTPALLQHMHPQQSYGGTSNSQLLTQHQSYFAHQQYQQGVPPLPASVHVVQSQIGGQSQRAPPVIAPTPVSFQHTHSQGANTMAAQPSYAHQVDGAQSILSSQNMKVQQLPAGLVSSNTVAASTVSYTSQQIDAAWQEYTAPGGAKYYHNALLQESTYVKPDALSRKDAASSGILASTTSVQAATTKRAWAEYEDSNTGRKYYSDGVTTTWEKPDGFVSKLEPAKSAQKSNEQDVDERTEPPKKKKRATLSTSDLVSSFASKEEAVAAFKGALLAKGIGPTLKWNEVVKLCESDSRWEACVDVLTVGERRQALAEYQTKRANEIRNEQRQERIRAKEAFGQLLADVLPSVTIFSAHMSRFSDVRSALSKDDRFYAVEDEAMRESLFLDFCDEFKKREERKKRSKKRDAQEAFVSFLQEKEENGSLTFASTWESFVSSLLENEKADPRFATSIRLSDSDRQLYFADFVIELQKAEDDKRRRIRDARRRAEKAQRDKYREFLRTLAECGKIFPYSRWRGVEEIVSQDETYSLVQAQSRDAPREIFEEFVEEWDEVYRRERSFLGRLVHPTGKSEYKLSTDTSYDTFKATITNEAAYSSEIQAETWRIIDREDPVSSARLFYKELIARAADANQLATSRRVSTNEDSSEDEGEIVEEGEVGDDYEIGDRLQKNPKAQYQPEEETANAEVRATDPQEDSHDTNELAVHEATKI